MAKSPNPVDPLVLSLEIIQWQIDKKQEYVNDESHSLSDRNNEFYVMEGLKSAQRTMACSAGLHLDEIVQAFHQKMENPKEKSKWITRSMEHALEAFPSISSKKLKQ